MSGSFEKSVKGGTKIKLAPPKAKYVEHILVATHTGEGGVAEIFRAMQNRLRDSTWTIVFKALIIVHLMIREGEPNVTLRYLAEHPSRLAISNFSDVQVQGTNIRHYYNYLLARAKSFRDTRIDWVREGSGRLKKQTVDKGLLRETESVQAQINALLKCELLSAEAENEITICAFRLLTMDLLVLYGIMNEGTINLLEHYFEMSQLDAHRALNIYKNFAKQTNQVVDFLGIGRRYEHSTRLEIPKLKHAPTGLTSSLQEYLNDPDFESNRRQYLAQKGNKQGGKIDFNKDTSSASAFKSQALNSGAGASKAPGKTATSTITPKTPPTDLIDFFGSIEQNQQPMALENPHGQQQMGFVQQNGQAPQFGYAQQQNAFSQSPPPFQNQQSANTGFGNNSNPFGQYPQQTGFQPQQTGFQPQQTGFQQHAPTGSLNGTGPQPFAQQQNGFQMGQQPTGSPFAQQQLPLATGATVYNPVAQQQQPQATGAANPFRQSMMPQVTGASMPSFTSPGPQPAQGIQNTNPFARSATMPVTTQQTGMVFSQPTAQAPQQQPFTSSPPHTSPFTFPPPQQSTAQLMPQRTGTNPFAKSPPPIQAQQTAQPLIPTATGTTNPFRQSMFINQQTGQGWQAGQGTMGGLEQIHTVPVFPGPAQ